MDPNREELYEDLRNIWKTLWQERVDDKVRAEGIANDDYPKLFVDRGTVIFATRDFRPLSFKGILERHKILNQDVFMTLGPEVSGWGKFIRTVISKLKSKKRVAETRRYLEGKKKKQHLRKGGYGWLHT